MEPMGNETNKFNPRKEQRIQRACLRSGIPELWQLGNQKK